MALFFFIYSHSRLVKQYRQSLRRLETTWLAKPLFALPECPAAELNRAGFGEYTVGVVVAAMPAQATTETRPQE